MLLQAETFLVDSGNSRVQVFDINFNFLQKIEVGSSLIRFVVVDNSGYMYISICENGVDYIKKYSPAGEYVSSYTSDSDIGFLYYYDNYLYFTNSYGLYKTDTDFNIINRAGNTREFWCEFGLGVVVSGEKLFVIYTNSTYSYYIARLDLDLNLEAVSIFENANYGIGCYGGEIYAQVNGVGLVKTDASFSGETAEYEVVNGGFHASYFTIDTSGNIYASSGIISKYSLDGSLIKDYLTVGSADGQVSGPIGIFIK